MALIEDLKSDHLVGREAGTAILMKELARGGMSIVFIAYQKTLKRQIAVKILPKSLLTSWAAEFFQQEAESAAILSHPNIIPVYEVGETEDFLFISMQLVAGLPLSRIIKRTQRHILPSRRRLSVEEAMRILLSILDALDYAHSQGIVHRDVKPANILVETHTSRPMVTDFGIAKVLHGPELNAPKIIGTAIYMAPEQIIGGSIDCRTDIYSLGIVLFELLVTNLPLPSHDTTQELIKMKVLLKDKLFERKPSEMNPDVDPEMDAIVLKALAHDPDKRFSSCREFMESLKSCQKRYGKSLQ